MRLDTHLVNIFFSQLLLICSLITGMICIIHNHILKYRYVSFLAVPLVIITFVLSITGLFFNLYSLFMTDYILLFIGLAGLGILFLYYILKKDSHYLIYQLFFIAYIILQYDVIFMLLNIDHLPFYTSIILGLILFMVFIIDEIMYNKLSERKSYYWLVGMGICLFVIVCLNTYFILS
ncbi:hypothetical protein B7939_04805 [Eggerthia catenaformis]|nr:hypothetical protein B7939_04805 [Eggerthia catenaformis]